MSRASDKITVLIASERRLHVDQDTAAQVRASQQGDRAAFGTVYQQYSRMIHGILLAHVPFADAEDLVQDVFLRAMNQIDHLREPNAIGAWLACIARNAAIDYRRRTRAVTELTEASATARPVAEAFEILDRLKELPETFRETLILRLVEGMTGPEIAERTGMTHDSVRVNLCRGMKMLREKLT